jgi:hypothetical protein
MEKCMHVFSPPKCCSSGEEHWAARINRGFVCASTTVSLSSHAIENRMKGGKCNIENKLKLNAS